MIDPIVGSLLLGLGGAAISSLWDTPSKSTRGYSADDPMWAGMQGHIQELEKQKGMAMELEDKKALGDMYDMQRRVAGAGYNTRDPGATARFTSNALGRGNMARRHQAATTGMQKELMLERLIGSQKGGLLGQQLLDRSGQEQAAAAVPTYGEKFGAALGAGAQLWGMSGGKQSPGAPAAGSYGQAGHFTGGTGFDLGAGPGSLERPTMPSNINPQTGLPWGY
jgi:hypothetical protein